LAILGVAVRFLIPDLPGKGMLGILALFYGAGLCAVFLAVLPMGWSAIPALALRGAGWKPIVFGVVGTLVLSVGVSQLGIEPKAMKEAMDIVRQPGAIAISLLALGGLAPLVEELIFRGLLYGWIAGRWNSIAAWAVSSIAFALAHYEPAHIVLVLPLAILFGYLRRRTNSLLPSFVAHVVNNSFAVLAAAYLEP
jgi:membrane protease YdiL (CAAX protease family)